MSHSPRWSELQLLQHEYKLAHKGIILHDQKPGRKKTEYVQTVSNVCKINIKPISLNHSYTGKRWKTPEHREWRKRILSSLPEMILPATNLKVYYEFGLSTKRSDIDNYVKNLQDILSEKYHFNDCEIYDLHVKKVIVEKSQEYFLFQIESIN